MDVEPVSHTRRYSKPPMKSKNTSSQSLEEYEKEKREKLDQLKRQQIEDKKMFNKLSQKARTEQRQKAKRKAAENPLRNDELAHYNSTLSKVRKNYS